MGDKVKVSCAHCGTTNYYPLSQKGKKIVCGRCHQPLPQPGEAIELLPQQIQIFLQRSSLPILIDFYSSSCAPCHIMNPLVDNLAHRRKGELMVVKINIDLYPQLAASFGIQAVPTFIIVNKGHERARTSGAMSEADFALWVASLI
ncbi:MAG: thioredoxin domain-containing protein [Candidatus Aminicenantales bacterium]